MSREKTFHCFDTLAHFDKMELRQLEVSPPTSPPINYAPITPHTLANVPAVVDFNSPVDSTPVPKKSTGSDRGPSLGEEKTPTEDPHGGGGGGDEAAVEAVVEPTNKRMYNPVGSAFGLFVCVFGVVLFAPQRNDSY